MSKHTPGPWLLFKSSDTRPHTVHLRNELGGVEIPKFGWVKDHSEEMLYNAHLISAAPELLEACKTVLTYLGEFDSDAGPVATCMNTLEAIINKAEGIDDDRNIK